MIVRSEDLFFVFSFRDDCKNFETRVLKFPCHWSTNLSQALGV